MESLNFLQLLQLYLVPLVATAVKNVHSRREFFIVRYRLFFVNTATWLGLKNWYDRFRAIKQPRKTAFIYKGETHENPADP
jgi:hypothetical protein